MGENEEGERKEEGDGREWRSVGREIGLKNMEREIEWMSNEDDNGETVKGEGEKVKRKEKRRSST